MFQLIEEQCNEEDGSEDADDQFYRDFKGEDDDACKNVTYKDEEAAGKGGLRKNAPHIVAMEEGNNIGDDETDVGDGSHNGNDRSRDHGRQRQTEQKHTFIVDAEVS